VGNRLEKPRQNKKQTSQENPTPVGAKKEGQVTKTNSGGKEKDFGQGVNPEQQADHLKKPGAGLRGQTAKQKQKEIQYTHNLKRGWGVEGR